MERIFKKKKIKGRWSDINNKVDRIIVAKYDRIKDWKMDPKGYFLVHIDKRRKKILVGYCQILKKKIHENNMIAVVEGKTAIEIVNTLIREKFISSLQHAADMGIELKKAEIAMKHKFKYIQDKELIFT